MERRLSGLFALALLFFGAGPAVASSTGITYQGRIVRPDGAALEAASVTLTVQISSAGTENCLLFQEAHSLDMRGSGGVFSIIIGSGSRVSSSIDGGFSLERIFANGGPALSPLPTCTSGSSYSPGSDETRRLTVSFNDGSGLQTLATQDMNVVPFALETRQVSGYGIDSLLRVDGVSAPAFNATEFGELQNLISGASGQYTKANELGGAALPALSSGESLRWNGAGWEAMTAGSVVNSITAGTGLNVGAGPGGTITSSGTLNLSDTGVAAGNYGDAANIPQLEVDAQGRLTSVTNVPLTTVANFSGSLVGDVSGTQNATSVDRLKGVAVSAATPLSGQVLRHDGSQWAPAVPNVADLKNASGDPQLPTNCTDSETLTFDSVDDKFICTAISVGSFTGSLSGDVSGPSNGTVVGSVGGVTAANVATGATLANNATNANTANTIVRRDGSGNFAAGQVTATTFIGNLTGTATNTTQIRGQPVHTVAPSAAGQTLVWDGAKYVAKNLKFQDLKTAAALAQFPTNCTAEQTMIYSAVTDAYECQNIMLVNTTSTMTGDVTGSVTSNTVVKLQNRDVAATAPASGQVLKWNGGAWAPAGDAGSVTNVATGTGLTGGPITTTGTISLANTSVTAGSYGSAGSVGTFTVDAQGRLTAASNTAIGGLNTSVLTAGTLAAARMPALTGDITTSAGAVATSLSTTGVAAGTYRSVTVDTKGRVTAGTNPTTIAGYGITDAVLNGGNTGAVTVGTNNATNLTLETNNAAALTILSGGNVGIGTASPAAKLDVAGEIKLGNTSSTCNSTTEGQQRYNSTTKTMEFCNGTAWASFGGGARGYQQTSASLGYYGASATASCSGGRRVVGGGCSGYCQYSVATGAYDGNGYPISVTVNVPPAGYPNGTAAYTCACVGGGVSYSSASVYAICAFVDD